MNYPIRTFVEIDEEELNQLKQTIAQQQAEIEEVDYEAISGALHKLHNFGVTQNNMDNALMADRLELMLRKASEK